MLIAERTWLALHAAKRRGVRLGNPHLKESVALMNEVARAARINFLIKMRPIIEEVCNTGVESYSELARVMNIRGIPTRTGNNGAPKT
jgi:DNA invertase Pin-like site-specific DNA recombinase